MADHARRPDAGGPTGLPPAVRAAAGRRRGAALAANPLLSRPRSRTPLRAVVQRRGALGATAHSRLRCTDIPALHRRRGPLRLDTLAAGIVVDLCRLVRLAHGCALRVAGPRSRAAALLHPHTARPSAARGEAPGAVE